MRFIQTLVGVVALIAAAIECYYLLGIGRWTTNSQPLTAALYVLFFWILWGYARVDDFVLPMIRIDSRLIKLLACGVIAGPMLAVVLIASTSNAAHTAVMKYGLLNGAILVCYSIVAMVTIFGDKWLGFLVRILKMGREFPARRGKSRRD